MTTQEAINELLENISNYPAHTIIIYDYGVIALKWGDNNDNYREFDSGVEMLEWLENEYRDENGNLKTGKGKTE